MDSIESKPIYKLAFLSSFNFFTPNIYYKPAYILVNYHLTHVKFAPADKTNASKLSNTM